MNNKMRQWLFALSTAVVLLAVCPVRANVNKVSFTNPMLWADVPDPDVIRVGEYFYMVSTTCI